MKFKDFNSFITERYQPLNEAKEKYKISQAKSSHPNSQGAYIVKFVGPDFNMPTMMAYLQTDPISAPAIQKVKENPSQYFFIYKTMKGGDPRFLAPNSKVWITYFELIDAKGPNGEMMYVGFDKPPYNNFVKWTDAEKLVNKQDPKMVQAGKNIVGNVANTGTQQINQAMASAVASGDASGATGTAGVPNAPGPDEAPAQQGATNNQADLEKSVADRAKEMLKAKQGGATQEGNQDINKQIDKLSGLSLGSRGPRVDILQNVIQKLADATHNATASAENKLNVRKGGQFDDIYGDHTQKALQTVLGLDKMPEYGMIDADVIAAIKKALAANPSITLNDLTAKPQAAQHAAPAPTPAPAQNGAQAAKTAQPAAGPATAQQSSSTNKNRLIKDTLIGNIRY